MNKDAAFFSSVVVASIALLSSIFVYQTFGLGGAILTILGGAFWIGVGYYFKRSKS
ncbi:hypothetical protein [Tepidibacillus sp. HK-1]|uniref:hypothetical protein n=1 Tax=Tepidibacillus sp. HK-1 TaxID=1883407 RepID=UPI0008574A6E|nr:hypothetical protein [Tepidibacillus sp. HK-1]GBF11275.1 hypothetical protein HK1_01299 [Tepidibacillus sp. HK-1]